MRRTLMRRQVKRTLLDIGGYLALILIGFLAVVGLFDVVAWWVLR